MSASAPSPGLVAKIDGYIASLWRAFCARLPDAEFHDDADATWFITGSTGAVWHNQVMFARFAQGRAERRVDELLALFRERGLPMLWHVDTAATPELPPLLEARGMTAGAPLTGMAMPLNELPEAVPLPGGLAVERVDDGAGLERWRRAYVAAFEMRDEEVAPLFDFYAASGFDEDAPFRHYVGSFEGELVASSTASFPEEGIAGLWHVGVLPAMRRRRFGTVMSFAPLDDARKRGRSLGVLYASPDGATVYPHLGFRTYSSLTSYAWEPS